MWGEVSFSVKGIRITVSFPFIDANLMIFV